MLKNKFLVAVLAATGFMMSAAASAQVYVGGTIGQSKWNDNCNLTTKCDKTSSAYKLLGGYNLDKNFALEASYFSLGKMNATANVGGTNANISVKGTGFEFAGVAKTDFTEEFGGFAKLGVARVKADSNSVISGLGKYSQDTTSTQPVIGFGLTYKITKELALRGELEMRRVKLGNDKDNVRNLSVGLQYAF
jgi:OOP family OmpA-OmpF porin